MDILGVRFRLRFSLGGQCEMQEEILVYCKNEDLSLISLFNRRFIRSYINENAL